MLANLAEARRFVYGDYKNRHNNGNNNQEHADADNIRAYVFSLVQGKYGLLGTWANGSSGLAVARKDAGALLHFLGLGNGLALLNLFCRLGSLTIFSGGSLLAHCVHT
jgi:hypothetical protein